MLGGLSRLRQGLTEQKTKVTTNKNKITVENIEVEREETLNKNDVRNIVQTNIQLFKQLPMLDITQIHLKLFSLEDLKAISVVKIKQPFRKEDISGGVDLSGTPLDPKMGTLDNTVACPTCHNTRGNCYGHYGMFEFPQEIKLIHPLHFTTVLRILQSTCFECGSLLSPSVAEELKYVEPGTRLQQLSVQKQQYCTNPNSSCQSKKQPTFKHPKGTYHILYKDENYSDQPLSVNRIYDNLLQIDNNPEVAEALGFVGESKPSDLILRGLPCCPLSARPYTVRDGVIQHDDLTTFYNQIASVLVDLNASLMDDRKAKLQAKKPGSSRVEIKPKKTKNRDEDEEEETSKKKKKKKTSDEDNDRESEKIISTYSIEVSQLVNHLYEKIFHMLDNRNQKYKEGSRVYKGINQRLGQKQGLIKGGLLGKRGHFTARSVASPDPNLKFGEIGLPEVYRNITYPYVITHGEEGNSQFFQSMLQKGEIKTITPISGPYEGIRLNADQVSKEYILSEGDIVEARLHVGNPVIFGRQPTLHKTSIMSARIAYFHPGNVIYVPLTYTTPLHLDFDGDELNLYFVQTYEAIVEAFTKLAVENNLISHEDSRPSMGLVYDSLIGLYLLTRVPKVCRLHKQLMGDSEKKVDLLKNEVLRNRMSEQTFVRKQDVFDMMTSIERYRTGKGLERFITKCVKHGLPFIDKNGNLIDEFPREEDIRITQNGDSTIRKVIYPEMWCGRALFSYLLPDDFQYSKGDVVIKNGILIKGAITKQHVGTDHNSIIQILHNDYGSKIAAEFITNADFVSIKFLNGKGFTFGYGDCVTDDVELLKKVDRHFERVKFEVESLGPEPKNRMDAENRERKILSLVNTISSMKGRMGEEISKEGNAGNIAKTSGAKGKIDNMIQTMFSLGQQYIDGKRPSGRLSWFREGDDSLESKGFIRSSFQKGLTPAEVFYNAMASRLVSIGTYNLVPKTGYIQSRLVSILRNVKVGKKGEVYAPILNSSSKMIFDAVYHEDGFDPAKLELVKMKDRQNAIPSFINLSREVERLNNS